MSFGFPKPRDSLPYRRTHTTPESGQPDVYSASDAYPTNDPINTHSPSPSPSPSLTNPIASPFSCQHIHPLPYRQFRHLQHLRLLRSPVYASLCRAHGLRRHAFLDWHSYVRRSRRHPRNRNAQPCGGKVGDKDDIFPRALHDALTATLDFDSLPSLSNPCYARIAPALRLATLFLYASHRFLWKVLYGAVRRPPAHLDTIIKGDEWAWILDEEVEQPPPPSSHQREEDAGKEGEVRWRGPPPETPGWLTPWIERLGRRLHIFVGPKQENMGCDGETEAVPLWKRADEEWELVMGIADEFWQDFLREDEDGEEGDCGEDASGREKDPDWQARRNRLHVALAIVLVHECVHCFWYMRAWSPSPSPPSSSPSSPSLSPGSSSPTIGMGVYGSPPEPRFSGTDPERELGMAWEAWMFGGRLESLGSEAADVNARKGFVWSEWRGPEGMMVERVRVRSPGRRSRGYGARGSATAGSRSRSWSACTPTPTLTGSGSEFSWMSAERVWERGSREPQFWAVDQESVDVLLDGKLWRQTDATAGASSRAEASVRNNYNDSHDDRARKLKHRRTWRSARMKQEKLGLGQRQWKPKSNWEGVVRPPTRQEQPVSSRTRSQARRREYERPLTTTAIVTTHTPKSDTDDDNPNAKSNRWPSSVSAKSITLTLLPIRAMTNSIPGEPLYERWWDAFASAPRSPFWDEDPWTVWRRRFSTSWQSGSGSESESVEEEGEGEGEGEEEEMGWEDWEAYVTAMMTGGAGAKSGRRCSRQMSSFSPISISPSATMSGLSPTSRSPAKKNGANFNNTPRSPPPSSPFARWLSLSSPLPSSPRKNSVSVPAYHIPAPLTPTLSSFQPTTTPRTSTIRTADIRRGLQSPSPSLSPSPSPRNDQSQSQSQDRWWMGSYTDVRTPSELARMARDFERTFAGEGEKGPKKRGRRTGHGNRKRNREGVSIERKKVEKRRAIE